MNNIIQVAVNNGLGIASFVALLYFIFKIDTQNTQNQKDLNNTLKEINKSMLEQQVALIKISDRLQEVENKIDKGEKKNNK